MAELSAGDICVICKKPDGQLVTLTERGLSSLIDYSQLRNEEDIHQHLLYCQSSGKQVFVHEECRKWFNNKRRLNPEKANEERKKTRRSSVVFNWKSHCFLCAVPCRLDEKHRSRQDWHLASTMEIRTTMLSICTTRLASNPDDVWALTVQARVNDCIDFVAAEARYHPSCRLRFRMGKSLVEDAEKGSKSKGRPVKADMMNFFDKTCNWLEEDTAIHTLQEFRDKLKEFSQKDDVYDVRHIKKLLKDVYGNHISFCEEQGKSNIIYFRNMADYIINTKYKERADNLQEERVRLIKAAANLVKAEIRENSYDRSTYPTCKDIESSWIPESLQLFLQNFTMSSLKQESIGQCIVKCASPFQIPPLLFGLAVELDHLYGSRWLIDELFKLGFSVSYAEVTRYKQACLLPPGTDDQLSSVSPDESFTQFIADNVDHNIATLDGRGLFHGMGIIASTSKSQKESLHELRISRPEKLLGSAELTSKGGVPLLTYNSPPETASELIKFKPAI